MLKINTTLFLLMLAGLPGAGSARAETGATEIKSCAKALAAFREGLLAFEREEWTASVNRLREAAAYGDCGGEILWVPLYGRWRYRFEPQLYLGLALFHEADCKRQDRKKRPAGCVGLVSEARPTPAGEACAEQWSRGSGAAFAIVPARPGWSGRCTTVLEYQKDGHESRLCCPAVDWFYQLPDRVAEVERLRATAGAGKCESVTQPVDWFISALSLKKGANHQICEELVEEVASVAASCPP